jgi:hypothetical protein
MTPGSITLAVIRMKGCADSKLSEVSHEATVKSHHGLSAILFDADPPQDCLQGYADGYVEVVTLEVNLINNVPH